jgi:hypothetical protein
VKGTRVVFEGIRVVNAGPQESSSTLWHDGVPEFIESRPTSSFDITEVKKECQNARSALAIPLVLLIPSTVSTNCFRANMSLEFVALTGM